MTWRTFMLMNEVVDLKKQGALSAARDAFEEFRGLLADDKEARAVRRAFGTGRPRPFKEARHGRA